MPFPGQTMQSLGAPRQQPEPRQPAFTMDPLTLLQRLIESAPPQLYSPGEISPPLIDPGAGTPAMGAGAQLISPPMAQPPVPRSPLESFKTVLGHTGSTISPDIWPDISGAIERGARVMASTPAGIVPIEQAPRGVYGLGGYALMGNEVVLMPKGEPAIGAPGREIGEDALGKIRANPAYYMGQLELKNAGQPANRIQADRLGMGELLGKAGVDPGVISLYISGGAQALPQIAAVLSRGHLQQQAQQAVFGRQAQLQGMRQIMTLPEMLEFGRRQASALPKDMKGAVVRIGDDEEFSPNRAYKGAQKKYLTDKKKGKVTEKEGYKIIDLTAISGLMGRQGPGQGGPAQQIPDVYSRTLEAVRKRGVSWQPAPYELKTPGGF